MTAKSVPPGPRAARAPSRAPILLLLLLGALSLTGCHRGKALPDLGAVPAFAMTDQAGKPFTNESLRGKVWAAAFVFTRCPMACPKVTRAMRGVQLDAAKRGVQLELVSFSIDPDNDTPEVLRKYAARYEADLATWTFVTGDAKGVKDTAERGFRIAAEGNADPSKPDFGINHGTQLVLVDRDQKIRGYYSSGEAEALGRLVTDAAGL